MSNKERIKQNNSRLNINNIDLSSILNTINKLPSSGEVNVKEHYLEGTNLVIELSNNQTLIIDISEYIGTSGLTEEQIEAINNMTVSIENGELIFEYDDTVLDIDFNIENGELIVEDNEENIEFTINENKEMEAIY
jgi:hypothetical protein